MTRSGFYEMTRIRYNTGSLREKEYYSWYICQRAVDALVPTGCFLLSVPSSPAILSVSPFCAMDCKWLLLTMYLDQKSYVTLYPMSGLQLRHKWDFSALSSTIALLGHLRLTEAKSS